ncbi:MAG: 50S ribosomal protein L4 [Planctomycetota bacterium]
MIALSVLDRDGNKVDSVQVDEAVFGGTVRYPLLKQAIVMYQANKRVGTAATRSRGMVAGSTRKLYRQKGTGNARMGTRRTVIRRGGGVAFAKQARDFSQRMPKKQRRLARDSAILAKLLSERVVLVEDLKFERARTKEFVTTLNNLKINRSCLVAVEERERNLYLSARNVPKVEVMNVCDLNAGDICGRQWMLFTKEAFMRLVNKGNSN